MREESLLGPVEDRRPGLRRLVARSRRSRRDADQPAQHAPSPARACAWYSTLAAVGTLSSRLCRKVAPADRLEVAAPAQLLGHGDQVGRLVALAERGDGLEDLAVRVAVEGALVEDLLDAVDGAPGRAASRPSTACSASRFCGGILPGSGAVSRSPRRGLRSWIVPVGSMVAPSRARRHAAAPVRGLKRRGHHSASRPGGSRFTGAAAISSAGAGGPSSRIFRSSCTSSQTTRFRAGFRSSERRVVGRQHRDAIIPEDAAAQLPIDAFVPSRNWAAKRPSVQMTRGLRISSWRLR